MYFGAEQSQQSYFGPNQGGGSLPQTVMRTGTIMPFNARDVRNDIQVNRVLDATQLPTAQLPAPLPQQTPMAGYFGAGDDFGAPTAMGATIAATIAAAAVGAAAGAALSKRGRRARGAGFGSLIGAGAMVIGGWLGGKIYLAATT